MMEFPTQAEKAIAEWRALTMTRPFAFIANKYGAFKDYDGTVIEWVFNDESIVRASGRGKAYTLEALLP